MHPSLFINDIWNGDETNDVFVAMSFRDRYTSRYEKVYKPAIESIKVNSISLKPIRVDERRSGDSIITEIVKGIAQARIVIADVSSMGLSADGYNAQRNGNVLYELGIAHSIKTPDRVIITKDDDEKMLFDLSSIPYVKVDFSNEDQARDKIREILVDRINESFSIGDFKLYKYSERITPYEYNILKEMSNCKEDQIADLTVAVGERRITSAPTQQGIEGLVREGIVYSKLMLEQEYPWYGLTERGRRLCGMLRLPDRPAQ